MGNIAPRLPTMGEPGDTALPPRSLSYLNLRDGAEVALVSFVAAALAWWFLEGSALYLSWLVLGILALVAFAVELPILNKRRVRNTSYSVEDEYVYITRGAVLRRSVFIPVRHILNVETVQGPLLRRFGFVKVRFVCITEVESLLPLDAAAVADIRRRLTEWKEVDEQ